MPVYQYHNKSGKRWLFKISVSGKQFLKRGFHTRSEALKAEAVFLATHSDRVVIPDFNMVLDAFMSRKKEELKETSYYSLDKYINKHFRGHIDNKRVDKLTYGDFDLWRSYLKKSKLADANRYINLMKSIFEFCDIYFGYRCRPAFLLVSFKNRKIEKPSDTIKYVSYQDFTRFLKFVDSDMLKLLFILTYFTGLRLGEVLGLQKECYKDGFIYIYQSLTNKVGKGKSVLVQPKSSKSNRKYLLPHFIDVMLINHINDNKLKSSDFIFPVSRTSLARTLKKACLDACIPPFHFHQLRSTDSTILHEMGFRADDIANYLGHESDKTTRKYYIEQTDQKKREISSALDERFGKDFL